MVSLLAAALLLAGRQVAPKVVAPPTSYDGAVTIKFSSRQKGVSFRCALDRAKTRRCTSPYATKLAPGTHTFRVQALDKRGRRSPFARVSFSVAAPAPSVEVGSQPVSLAFGGGSLWTADFGSGAVTRVDPVGGRVVATIHVGGSPGGVAFGVGAVWVGDFEGTNGVSKIDPATNTVVAHLHPGGKPAGLLADGQTLWVADYDGFVERLDTQKGSVVARIPIGGNAEALALGFGLLWVTNQDGSIAAVDPATNAVVGGRVAGDSDMDGVAIAPDAVWSTSFYGLSLLRIDPATRGVTRRVQLGGQAEG
jgi:YVTN family beta-propeller protein